MDREKQRLEALDKANAIRCGKAQVKRELHDGKRNLLKTLTLRFGPRSSAPATSASAVEPPRRSLSSMLTTSTVATTIDYDSSRGMESASVSDATAGPMTIPFPMPSGSSNIALRTTPFSRPKASRDW
jgi:hypothetical protein